METLQRPFRGLRMLNQAGDREVHSQASTCKVLYVSRKRASTLRVRRGAAPVELVVDAPTLRAIQALIQAQVARPPCRPRER